MCTTCGCGHGEAVIDGAGHHHHDHRHHDHPPLGAAHDAGLPQARIVEIERDILAKNDGFAARNRARLAERATLALNLVSSPGSGKTTLLAATIRALGGQIPVAVIEGDQQTARDAERIREAGAPAVQINTGKGCHLDAHMVGHALERLDLPPGGIVFIENVGNLVCPAGFDLGEAAKVVILSVTEGEDKPLKYPDMFRAARLMILNKADLLPHIAFDTEACIGFARQVNPEIEVLILSAQSGAGMDGWRDWLAARRAESAPAAAE